MFELLLILFPLGLILWIFQSMQRPKNYPPGPTWLPLVGNTPALRREARKLGGLHLVYEELSRRYNSPIIGLKLGRELFVAVLHYPMVREVLTRDEFDGRPDNFFIRLRTMGSRLGITCTDGPLWAEHRNFTIRHLRSAGYGRQAMDIQIESELTELLNIFENLNEQPVWPGQFLAQSVINVLWIFAAGCKISRSDERLSRLLLLLGQRAKAFDMSGGLLNSLPWLRFIAPEWTGYNLLLKFNKELNNLFMETINQHRQDYSENKSDDDLIYAYLKKMKEEKQANPNTTFTDIQLTMVLLDIFIAGSQTTSTTLDIAIMMTVVRPDLQQKIYEEISQFKKANNDRVPTNVDRAKLPFTDAYLLEIFRIFSVVPVGGPRRVLSDVNLGGYRIPKNATVVMSFKTVHMDKQYWGDPEEFRPERFLDKDMKICNTERILLFGQGKRRCLGEILAKKYLFTFFVGIIDKFELKLPKGVVPPSTIFLPGITLSPKPYKVIFKKRLSDSTINLF